MKYYRADNGIFQSKPYLEDIRSQNQSIDFCAPGSHHQNGITERSIRTLTTKARTMLLHASFHWKLRIHLNLWPYAVAYAVDLWNHLPAKDGTDPITKFSPPAPIRPHQSFHVFGCPVFILNSTLRDKGYINRWGPRCSRGIYLGLSRYKYL